MPPANDPYKTTQAPEDTYPEHAERNNSKGTLEDLGQNALERFKIREICEGWPVYRDAAEWRNYRSMFHDDAYIATSWKQGTIDEFIKASIEVFDAGTSLMYILHRVTGQTVDIQGNRAVSKMKVTITCRFSLDGIETDNEADCRFFFLLDKREGRWKISFYTLLFDKDKMIPVNPNKVLNIPEEEVAKYPSGYKYLAWCESKINRPPKMDLNAHGPERDILYAKCKDWLEGRAVEPNLTGHDKVQYGK